MLRHLLLIALLSLATSASAGMMGGMGGGMMGSQSSPAEPPAKDADPAIQKGYALSQQYCAQCHQPPNPDQHSASDWPAVVTRMQTYIQQQHRHAPTAAEQQLILEYLREAGSKHQ